MRKGFTFLVMAAALVWVATAHVRLRNPSNDKALFWGSDSISITLQEDGSDDVMSRGHMPALRNAIASWNAASGTDLRLVENTDPDDQERTDWASNSVHLVMFDEENSSGYFPSGSGIVAITPVYFQSSGRITDADILFNGRSYRFTTRGEGGAYDVGDVGSHEIGHLMGLDHSGWAGATMYPYVDPRMVLHRSISSDEVHGLRAINPDGDPARISGRIVRAADGSKVKGAHVVARLPGGVSIASILTDSDGDFRLRGLEAGTYELYATPLEGPVRASNIGDAWTIETDFESTILGTWAVSEGDELDLDDLDVGADVEVSLGRSTDTFPMRLPRGQTVNLLVRGRDLDPGGELVSGNPALEVTNASYFGTLVQFTIEVPGNSPIGHVDLEFTNLQGELTILPGALEVTPSNPGVAMVTPTGGDNEGGSPMTVTGWGFRSGSRVVIGDQLYMDGDEDCEVVDSTTIELTTRPMVGGIHDVVVIDPTGIEGRLADAFQATAIPVIEAIFPAAGNMSGGTVVTLSGEDFVVGATVTFDGVEQEDASVLDSDMLQVVTEGDVTGSVVVTVQNPAGGMATTSFEYVDAPDPQLFNVNPSSGPRKGGTEIFLTGMNFVDGMRVFFGSDPDTGEGGVEADEVEFVDASTMIVVTPSTNSGLKAIVITAPETSQSDVLEAAFEFEGSNSSGGGGSACGSLSPGGPPTLPRILSGAGWFLLAWLLSLLIAARARTHGLRLAA